MISTYAVSLAGRPVSYTQQREIDAAAGELAAAFAAIGRTVRAALTRRRGGLLAVPRDELVAAG
jgi:hypothetical protein